MLILTKYNIYAIISVTNQRRLVFMNFALGLHLLKRYLMVEILAILFRLGFWLDGKCNTFHGELKYDLAALLKVWSRFSGSKVRIETAAVLQPDYARAMGYDVCPACGWAIDRNNTHPFCEKRIQEMQEIKARS